MGDPDAAVDQAVQNSLINSDDVVVSTAPPDDDDPK
jgi:hypothetical protein